MNTIEYYLRQLDYYRKLLITNLRSLGIECNDTETYNTLIPKIYSLPSSGNIIVKDYSLAYCESEEDANYAQEHITPTEVTINFANKFVDSPGLKHLSLNKFLTDERSKNINYMFGNSSNNICYVKTLDASGCTLTADNFTYIWSSPSVNSIININLSNAIIGRSALWYLTSSSASNKILNVTNMTFNDADLTNIFNQGLYKTVEGLDTIKFTKPITTIKECFSALRSSIDLQLNIPFADTISFPDYSASSSYENGPIMNNWNNAKFPFFPLQNLKGKTINRISFSNSFNNEPVELIFPEMTATDINQPYNFYYCTKVKVIDVSNIALVNTMDYTGLTQGFDLSSMFYNVGSKLTNEELNGAYIKLNPSMFNGQRITYFSFAFYNCKLPGLENIDLSNIIIGKKSTNYYSYFGSAFYGTVVETFRMVEPVIENPTNMYMRYGYMLGNTNNLRYAEIKMTPCTYNRGDYSFNAVFINNPNLEEVYWSTPACSTTSVEDLVGVDLGYLFTYNSSGNHIKKLYEKLHTVTLENMIISVFPSFNTNAYNNNPNICVAPALRKINIINCEQKYTKLYMFMRGTTTDYLDLGDMDVSYVTDFRYILSNNTNLIDLVFMKNYGKAFTKTTQHYIYYTLDLSASSQLNYTSLMDVINKLYDLNISYGVYDVEGNPGTGTLYTQDLILGTANLAKLTPEEIAIATNKGWTVS